MTASFQFERKVDNFAEPFWNLHAMLHMKHSINNKGISNG